MREEPSEPYEIVDRPPPRQGRPAGFRGQLSQLHAAIVATARTGRAVRFMRGGRSPHTVRVSVMRACQSRGVQAHVRIDGDVVTAWAERR